MTAPRVIVCILTYNDADYTIECLRSVFAVDYPNFGVILIDNGSKPGIVSRIRAAFPDLEILENGANLGFPEGQNRGIRRALEQGADQVLLLNNDTEVPPELLTELVKVAEEPDAGMVAPKICYYDEPHIVWAAGGVIDWERGVGLVVDLNQPDRDDAPLVSDHDWVTGCALLVKREVIERIGYMDAEYFLYFDDLDWCVRARRAGYRVICYRGTTVLHKVSRAREVNRPSLVEYYCTRNRLHFLAKFGKMQKSFFRLESIKDFYHAAMRVIAPPPNYPKVQLAHYLAKFHGYIDYYRGKTGPSPYYHRDPT